MASPNQVRFDAAYGDEPGTVLMQMGTVTPGFDEFLRRVDGGSWETEASRFVWQLHPGANRLEMRVKTRSGVQGPVSVLELNYRP